jgi:hypothetical protein
VAAGLANDVEAVNQYAAVMYDPTANGTAEDRSRAQPQMIESNPNVAIKLPKSPEYRRRVRSFLTAIPKAFFCPIKITSFLPRVIPV